MISIKLVLQGATTLSGACQALLEAAVNSRGHQGTITV